MTPRVFTEHGAIMVASVLNSQRAIEVSLFVVRAFVQLREALVQHKEIARKVGSTPWWLRGNHSEGYSEIEEIR